MFVDMTWKDFYRKCLNKMAAVYEAGESEAIVSRLLESLGSMNRSAIIRNGMEEIPEMILKKLEEALLRILKYEPIQYITGETIFFQLLLKVNPSVLIPRPETEELVELVLKSPPKPGSAILDIGTGSGCIAIALKKNLPDALVTAVDKSPEALVTARNNARLHEVEIDFLEMDFLQECEHARLGIFDIIISNPPYIPFSEKESLPLNVSNFEPALALFPEGEDPYVFFKTIASFSTNHLKPSGAIYVEIHENLAANTIEIFEKAGFHASILRDVFGKERMIEATRYR